MKKKITDIDLIQGIKNGNKKFENLLYERYKIKLEEFLKYKYPFDQEHDDNVSEILIKIFENLEIYDVTKAQFNTWVQTIAQNYMIDKAKKYGNQPIRITLDGASDTLCVNNTNFFADTSNLSVGSSSFTSYTPKSFNQPDQDMENKDALDFISNKIGVEDFHLLTMKYGQGYDYNEMEKEMRVSSSTISNRVNYVKSRLRKNKGD